MSRTSPLANTTVSARTHSRVVPYLNVAAPCSVGRDHAAGEGSREGRCWRIVLPDLGERGIELDERDAGADADPVVAGRHRCDSGEPCSAGARRAASRRRSATTARRSAARTRPRESRRRRQLRSRVVAMPAANPPGKVRGVFEERGEHIRIAFDPRSRRCADRRSRADGVTGQWSAGHGFDAGRSASKSGLVGETVRRCASASPTRSATMSACAAAMSNRSPGSAARSNNSGVVRTVRASPRLYAPIVMKCALYFPLANGPELVVLSSRRSCLAGSVPIRAVAPTGRRRRSRDRRAGAPRERRRRRDHVETGAHVGHCSWMLRFQATRKSPACARRLPRSCPCRHEADRRSRRASRTEATDRCRW